MAPSRTSSSRIKTAHNLDLEGFQESQFVSSSHHNSKQNRSISEQIQFLELVRVTTDYVRQPDHRRHRLWSFGDSPSSPSTPSWMYREGGGQEDWRSRGPQVDGGGGAVEGPRMEAWRKVRETTSERRAREAPRDFVNACAVWPRGLRFATAQRISVLGRVCGGGNVAGPDWFRSPVITGHARASPTGRSCCRAYGTCSMPDRDVNGPK